MPAAFHAKAIVCVVVGDESGVRVGDIWLGGWICSLLLLLLLEL